MGSVLWETWSIGLFICLSVGAGGALFHLVHFLVSVFVCARVCVCDRSLYS